MFKSLTNRPESLSNIKDKKPYLPLAYCPLFQELLVPSAEPYPYFVIDVSEKLPA